MKQKTGRKLLGVLLTLAMVVGLMPGMGLTAYAAPTETLLTTITATAKEQASYSTANVATVSFSYTAYGSSAYLANWGWWGYGWSATVNAAEGYTITKCVFYDDSNRTATDSEAPFVVETTEEDKTPKVNGTPIAEYTSKGIKKIEVYGYSKTAATYSVTVTPGSNMTKTTDSGAASQSDLSGAITDVVYTANDGYYFPEGYSVAAVNGISVARNSYTQITVSGTPTADATITLTAPTAKTTPDAPATAVAVDCTTADNNDGKLTGVTTAMEYKKSDAENWTAGTGSDITDLVPGTYYVRYKATDTTNASGNQELSIAGYTAPTYEVTYKVANGTWSDDSTTDKTETVQSGAKPASVPTGMKAASGYTGGAWDTDPADATITGATTFTYTFTAKQAATVTKAPTAKTLTYNGQEQALVTAGEADGGEMQYAPGTKDAATGEYSTSIPTATNAGTYYVWYKAVADDSGNYADSEPQRVAAAISQGAAAPTAPTSDKLTYNGADQALLKAGSVPEGCKMLYALGTDATTAPTDGWSTDVPTGKDAGTYYAWYKIDGGANYNDVAPVCISVEVAKATGVPTDAQKPAAKTGLVANGQAQALLTAPTSLPEGYTKIQYSTDGGKTWSDTIPTGTVAGAYAVSVKYVGDANHSDIDGGSISVTVVAPEPEPQPEPEPEPQPAANPSGIPILTITSAGSDALNFAMTNASGVDGFDLFFRICDGKEDYPLYASVTGTSYTVAGLKTGRSYKGYARAWVMKNGAKQYVLEASPTAHCFTNNGTNKETNPADIKLKTPSLTVRLGKSKAIKASVLKVKKGALATHVAKLRYFSDNPAVATVNAKGKVKGVGAGSCNVYVLTTNGIWKTVPVTVDASPTRVKLTKVKRSMAIGETQALGAKVVLNPKGAITTLTWTSSNEAVATVDPNGNVTAKAKGKATITVTAANGKKAKVTIRVK